MRVPEKSSMDVAKQSITAVLILFIVIIVYFSGPSTAFTAVGYPTMLHKPGSKDINVSVTFYKEAYEAIGTLNAVLMRIPPNPTSADITAFQATPWVYETVGAQDYNCWAAPYNSTQTGSANTSFYSYELEAYYAPGAPLGKYGGWTHANGWDGNFDIFAYGYMWNPWVNLLNSTTIAAGDFTTNALRMPGDSNFVYKFIDYSNRYAYTGVGSGFSYDGQYHETDITYRNIIAGQYGYYGYGYNYTGNFTCVFRFRSVPEGTYLAIVPYINGIKVGSGGYDSGGAGVAGQSQGTGSLILIKDVNTDTGSNCGASPYAKCSTDVNFTEPNGTKRISFTVPRGSTGSATVITIDVNTDDASVPSGADMTLGKATRPPAFVFGADVETLTLTNAATLRLYWSGILTTAQAVAMSSTIKLFQHDKTSGVWKKLDTSVNLDLNELSTLVTSFI